MKKKILLTGAAGFIGFQTALALQREGHFVLGLDNFNDYYAVSLKKAREQRLKEAGVDIIHADLCDQKRLKNLFESHCFTHLIHLAAQAGVRYSQERPDIYVHSNLEGFCTILEVCRAYPKTQFIFASSSSVYGLNEKIPFSETDVTDRPANLYAATKKADELLAFSYHSLYGIATAGLRFFTVYGPWGRPDMAYYHFAECIAADKPLSLYGEGKMARDFTYIDDITSALTALIDKQYSFEIFNLGNNRPEKVLTLVSILEKEFSKKAIIHFKEGPKGEVPITFADISKAQKWLGYNPKTNLEEGMHRFVDWFKSWKAIS